MGESVGVAHVRALILATVVAMPAMAHEIGTTQVRAHLGPGATYRIDVIAAPQPLLGRLQARAGRPRTAALDRRALQAALQAYAPQLASAAEIDLDATRATPRVTVLPIRESPQGSSVTVRYTGDVPPAAKTLSWRSGLTYASYAFTVERPGAPAVTIWLEGDERSAALPLRQAAVPASRLDVARQYVALGFTHIVPLGLDHILFVLAMYLLSTGVRAVLAQVTAFTVAHSITLGLSIYGLVSAPGNIVEPLIAVSIAWVAIENLLATRVRPWRIAIVFGFGLLHGLGFAGVLRELGLPRSQFAPALVSFNAGVELGQLAVIGAAWLVLGSWARGRPWYRDRILVPGSLAIAAVGIFWAIQRSAF